MVLCVESALQSRNAVEVWIFIEHIYKPILFNKEVWNANRPIGPLDRNLITWIKRCVTQIRRRIFAIQCHKV